MKLVSWNINGIRAAYRKGLLEYIQKEQPDILCLQEIKALPEQIPPALKNTPNYHILINSAERKGYSGVATYTKEKPQRIQKGFGIQRFDSEGRVLITEYETFTLFNIYFPNGKRDNDRLQYKLDFYDSFLTIADNTRDQGKHVIVCGDFNTAHTAIDLSRPKPNEKHSGFLPIEREWIDTFISHGYIDTFRAFHPEPERYSWWDQKTHSRENNIGWRIDYFFCDNDLMNAVTDADIQDQIYGSDHCPITLTLEEEA